MIELYDENIEVVQVQVEQQNTVKINADKDEDSLDLESFYADIESFYDVKN